MIQILAPAKVNLGLEILGKRQDGYHQMRTILCATSIFDSLEVNDHGPTGLHIDDLLLVDNNLVDQVLNLVKFEHPDLELPSVKVRKRIPVASGLGGASSDAASTLLALQRMYPEQLDACTLESLASRLGSDLPFFLRTGVASASGRGGSIEPLPYQRFDMVVVNPLLSIPAKTATMYGLVTARDWTDGALVESLAASLKSNVRIRIESEFHNAFLRPLHTALPELAEVASRIGALANLPVQLSGAGPAHFVLCRDVEHRQWVRNRLRTSLAPAKIRVLSGRSVMSVLLQEH